MGRIELLDLAGLEGYDKVILIWRDMDTKQIGYNYLDPETTARLYGVLDNMFKSKAKVEKCLDLKTLKPIKQTKGGKK